MAEISTKIQNFDTQAKNNSASKEFNKYSWRYEFLNFFAKKWDFGRFLSIALKSFKPQFLPVFWKKKFKNSYLHEYCKAELCFA